MPHVNQPVTDARSVPDERVYHDSDVADLRRRVVDLERTYTVLHGAMTEPASSDNDPLRRRYRRLRIATRDLARKLSNDREAIAVHLGRAYSPSGDPQLPKSDARLLRSYERRLDDLEADLLDRYLA